MATQTIENFNTLDLETLASVEGGLSCDEGMLAVGGLGAVGGVGYGATCWWWWIMFDLKSYILGMVSMAVMSFLDKPIMSFLEKHKVTNSAKKKF